MRHPGTPMIFAYDTDDGSLLAFAAHAEAAAHCKAIDVSDGYWLFFDDDGSPLEARFEPPGESGDVGASVGAYSLQRAMSGRWLQERLGKISVVRGCGLSSVDELVETLRINRGKRAAAANRRG